MIEEFKKFIFRGNVIDMAVGVVIGTAFTKIVNSLVNDIIMPLIGLLTAGIDFTNLKIKITSEVSLSVGLFINTIVEFLIIAVSIFIVVKLINTAREKLDRSAKKKKEEKAPEPVKSAEVVILEDIRELLKENSVKKETKKKKQ